MVDFAFFAIYKIAMIRRESYRKQNRLVLLFKVLANANRYKIIKFISQCEGRSATCGQIARSLNISDNNLSNHLKLMRISRVVRAKQQGNFMHYSIADSLVIKLISTIE